MTRAAALLAITLAHSLALQTAARGVVVSCVHTLSSAGDKVRHTFLASDPELPSASPRLYRFYWHHSLLHRCTWSDDAAKVRGYAGACRAFTHVFSDDLINITSFVELEGVCQRAGSMKAGRVQALSTVLPQVVGDRSEVRNSSRVKRGFIVPGTLWCGSGNKALSQENLGVFSETDKCCREHDQCKHTITSFHIKYGVFNSNIFTMSHCDCDNKFHSCLMQAQDSISDVVGYTFFNVLKMHCFKFAHRLQCAQRNWFGMCKETKMFLYADVHPPRLYNSSDPYEGNSSSSSSSSSSGGGWLPNATKAAELLSNGMTQAQLLSGYRLAALPSAAPGSHTSTPAITNTSRGQGLAESTESGRADLPSRLEAMQHSCTVYKDLDDCKTKILPQQRRFGFHNTKAQTLYHCNCTTRLFQTLADQTQLSEVQALVLGHVALSCFMMPLNCTAGVNCTAELRKAPLPELDPRSGTHMEQQHPLEVQSSKLGALSLGAASRNQRAFKLRKLCLRIVRSKLSNTRPRVKHAN